MMMHTLLRCTQCIENIRNDGLARFMRDLVSFDRKAILAEKRLEEPLYATGIFEADDIVFLDITPELLRSGRYRYAARNRYLKAKEYLRQGYGGHAIARGREIIGDIWHYPALPSDNANGHPDLKWLGIKLEAGCAYSFDTYLVRDARGGNRSLSLQGRSYDSLRRKGFSKVYAYYWADNIAAVWNTRVVFRWTERKVLRVRSIFLRRKVIGEQVIPDRSATGESDMVDA